MSNITSFDTLDNEIKKATGRPTVLEALWDGDTQGWFLILNLYTETGKFLWKHEKCQYLGTVNLGGDIRLFTGEVPLWPEAVLAKDWGQKASEKYGLTFYFPSDKEPDDDCPTWTQRHLAIKCADCGKSIIPTDSPYLPKDICYNCHLIREQNERFKRNEFYKDAVYGTYQIKGNPVNLTDFSIHHYLLELVESQKVDNIINIIEFNNEELLTIKARLYDEIKSNLASYKKSDLQGERRKFGTFELVTFEDKEYELESRFNNNHQTLSSLIYRYKTFEQAALQNWTYQLHVVKGITNRDDAFLRFIHFVSKGITTLEKVNERYKSVLTEAQIIETLNKLQKLGCMENTGNILKITERGQSIL